MNIFGIGLPEMAVIAAIALLVFGPKRLPEMGKTLGRTLRGFQTASQEFEREFRSVLRTEETSVSLPPTSPPSAVLTSGAQTSDTQSASGAPSPADAGGPSGATGDGLPAPSSPPSA